MGEQDRRTVSTRRKRDQLDPSLDRHPYLIVLAGPDVGRRYRLFPGPTRVGRSREHCEICLKDEGLSRSHAELHVDPQGVTVRDLGSTNGTRCAGDELGGEEARPLQDGDKIELGDAVILKLIYQSALTAQVQEHVYSRAVRDGLTEVYNRAYLDKRLADEFARAQQTGEPLAVLMLDLDHFKQINDRHGHAAGDAVLKTVCRRLEANLREKDVLARYGGEELTVVLVETGVPAGMRVAERLRRAIGAEPVVHEQTPIPVTVSIGAAATTQGDITSLEELLQAADANVYRAKEGGRDRVCGPSDPD